MNKTMALLASAALLSVSTLAFSDPQGGMNKAMPAGKGMGMDQCMHMGGQMMDMADTNKDGKISKDEFAKHHDQMFTQMDKNADGMIDAGERAAMKDQMKSQMKGMQGMEHGKGPSNK